MVIDQSYIFIGKMFTWITWPFDRQQRLYIVDFEIFLIYSGYKFTVSIWLVKILNLNPLLGACFANIFLLNIYFVCIIWKVIKLLKQNFFWVLPYKLGCNRIID